MVGGVDQYKANARQPGIQRSSTYNTRVSNVWQRDAFSSHHRRRRRHQ